MDHLALEIFDLEGTGSKFANLEDDASITIIITSNIFDKGDIWSLSFVLNVIANAHIFGTAGEMHGGRLHEQLHKRRARLWADGLPLYFGYLILDDNAEVDDNGDVDVSFESGNKTFLDRIEGAKANQVPLMSDVFIGMAVDRERTLYLSAIIEVTGYVNPKHPEFGGYFPVALKGPERMAQEFPKYVRTDGTWIRKRDGTSLVINRDDTINTDFPYDSAHPYCNIRICYQRQVFEDRNGTLEKVAKFEPKVSEPRRINTAPNFYMLYWLDCLMKHLKIHVEENQMMGVEDLRRLFFVNTKCGYESRGDVYTSSYMQWGYTSKQFVPINTEETPSWKLDAKQVHEQWTSYQWEADVSTVNCSSSDISWRKAFANSENFPNADIKDVIEAIENGFGVRFLFNDDYTKVRIVLLRNVFRSNEIHKLDCQIGTVTKQESSIRGFRLTYGAGEEDTNYFYRGFSNKLSEKEELWPDTSDTHDYSQWDMTLRYKDIKNKVNMLNRACYVDVTTGNSYIVKIDENYKTAADSANPTLVECAGFMDAEYGDCTGEEETIEEVRIGFSPIIENVIPNGYALFVGEEMGVSSEEPNTLIDIDTTQQEINKKTDGSIKGDFTGCTDSVKDALYQNGLFEIATATMLEAWDGNNKYIRIYNNDHTAHADIEVTGYIREGYRLYLQDNYKPGEDLESPLEKADWGITLGIMRGSGSGAYIKAENDDKDKEGNETWYLVPGNTATAHSDTCDDSGDTWDYNGTQPGTGSTGYTGYEFGDKLLADFGCQNPCDLKTMKGRAPSDPATSLTIKSYDKEGGGSHLLILTEEGYYATVVTITDKSGVEHTVWLSCVGVGDGGGDGFLQSYGFVGGFTYMLQYGTGTEDLKNYPEDVDEILSRDAAAEQGAQIIAVDPKYSTDILKTACGYYLAGDKIAHLYTDDQVSMKLRVEKPNPFYDPSQPEGPNNRRYLEITNPELRRRGLMDRFYKEYSYWVLNGRIANIPLHMELAQLLGIDMTVRQQIGDITGFVKKMQLTISKKNGLSDVQTEVLYL